MFCTRAYLNVLNISVAEILRHWGRAGSFHNLSWMLKLPGMHPQALGWPCFAICQAEKLQCSHLQGLSLEGSRAGAAAAPSPGTQVCVCPCQSTRRRCRQSSWRVITSAGGELEHRQGFLMGVPKEQLHSGDRALVAVLPWNRSWQICQTSRRSDAPVKYQSWLAVRVCWHSFQGIREQQ